MAAQVKAGKSFFAEPAPGGWLFRGETKHRDYWLGHSLPVIVVLCDLDAEVCYWREIRADTIEQLRKGWKTVVPAKQPIARATADALHAVAGRTNRPRVDLQLRSFLMEKYSRRIALAPLTESPRDYHFFEELAEIDGKFVSITFVDMTIDRVSEDFFGQCREWRSWNNRNAAPVQEVHVYVISQDAATLPAAHELHRLAGEDIRVFRLVESEFSLEEVDDEGWMLMWFPSDGPDAEPMRSRRLRED